MTTKSFPQGETRLSSRQQVTIPAAIVDELGFQKGVKFNVTTDGKSVKLTPKSPTEKADSETMKSIAEGLKAIREGRVYGPYGSVEEWKADRAKRQKA